MIYDGILIDCLDSAKKVEIPNSVTTIKIDAFTNCKLLKEVKIPEGIYWDEATFVGCENLKITCSDGKTIPYYNNGLLIGWTYNPTNCQYVKGDLIDCLDTAKKAVIPNSVIEINDEAFTDCTKLTSIKIPNSVTYHIPTSAFENCTSLKSITIPNSVRVIGDLAFL